MKEQLTSKGGTIIFTSSGLIHKSGPGAYSGAIHESGVTPEVLVKRGRGRPKKDSGESGAQFDFSELIALTKVKVPKWKGSSTFHNFK